jgi:hypothetical protein
MYRVGSRIRVRVSAPNGDQPIWAFAEADPAGQANVAIGYGGLMPSRPDLPVVPGVTTTTGLPPCPGLRGEPCRDYQPLANRAASLTAGTDTSDRTGSGSNSGPTGGALGKCAKKKHAAEKHKQRGCRKKKRHHKK